MFFSRPSAKISSVVTVVALAGFMLTYFLNVLGERDAIQSITSADEPVAKDIGASVVFALTSAILGTATGLVAKWCGSDEALEKKEKEEYSRAVAAAPAGSLYFKM